MVDFSKLKALFPHASKAFLKNNPNPELQDTKPEHHHGSSLVKASPRKEESYERAHVIITAFTVRPRDCDNLGGGCKALLDAIKKLRLIPDDDPYSIELEVKQRHVDHFKQEKTLVEITYL